MTDLLEEGISTLLCVVLGRSHIVASGRVVRRRRIYHRFFVTCTGPVRGAYRRVVEYLEEEESESNQSSFFARST